MQVLRFLRALFLIGVSLTAYGQALHFSAPFSSEEIPQVPVAIFQDRQGFMWFGTTDGLYRYDGNEVKEFRKNPTDSLSLPGNYIRTILEDQAGNIWIGTNDGIARYNTKQENFTRFPRLFPAQTTIIHLMEDHRGILWISSYLGLFSFDPKEESLRNFLPDPERRDSSLSHKTVWSTFEDSQHRIWVSTHLGFTLFDNDDRFRFRAYFGDWTKEEGLATDRVFSAVEQPVGTIWLGTHDGVFRVKEHQDTFQYTRFHTKPNIGPGISHNFIDALASQAENRLWAATYRGGLNEFILSEGGDSVIAIIHHQASEKRPNSLGSNEVKCVFVGRQGLVWAGTNRRIEVGDRLRPPIGSIDPIDETGIGVPGPICKVLFVDSHDNLWVGSTKGLSFLPASDRKSGNYRFQHFTYEADNPFSLSDNNIMGINEDDQGVLWVLTKKGGINYTKLREFGRHQKFQRLNKISGKDHNPVHELAQFAPGKYWLASDHGFAEVNLLPTQPHTFSTEYYPMTEGDHLYSGQSPSIINANSSDLQQDRFGNFWVGTYNGISRIRRIDGKTLFDNYVHEVGQVGSLSNNSFRCFHLDAKGRLWVGTRSGLNLVLQENQEDRVRFRAFGSTEGLVNDVIHAIEEDDQGFLWLSTNRGLVHFNPDAEADTPKVIHTYTKANGLPHNSFIYRSSARSQDGTLYFGTTAGIGVFHPDSLRFNPYPPSLRFTQLEVLNEEVKPSTEENAVLSTSISLADEINLRHWQKMLTLRFTAINFRHPERNRYQYQFSALGDEWIDLGHQSQLSFTNIPSGVHELKLKGSNNDGVWQEEPISLRIVMRPPPWRSWWAYVLYALGLSSLLYTGFRYRLNRKVATIKAQLAVDKARLETRQRVRDRNAADFHDELGHRLTKIMLFTELAERENDKASVGTHLQKIKSVAIGLSMGIRDLIWSLDTQQDTLFATVIRLREFGDQLFEYSDSRFRTEGIAESLVDIPLAPEVRKHTLLLFKEAMNNALKYARADSTLLSVKIDAEGICLTFEDNGLGFSVERNSGGYGIKNMASRAKKIGGSFHLESTPGTGTRVQLRIKNSLKPVNTPKEVMQKRARSRSL